MSSAHGPDEGNRVSKHPTDALRALIADSHRTFAEVLAAGLGVEGRFAAADVAFSPSHARYLLRARRYDILVLDPGRDVGSWMKFLRVVVGEQPTLIVAVISELRDINLVIEVLALGVRTWLSKDTSFDGFLHAIDEAVMGRTTLPAALLRAVLRELLARPATPKTAPSFLDELTPRQCEVLRCLAVGMSRAEIADQMRLSPNTVRTHVQEVLRKAGVHSTLAAVARARAVLGNPPDAPDGSGD